MCGIAGIIDSHRDNARSAVLAMNQAQAHRGPDDVGVEVLPFGRHFLGLGHRRLAILDLSPAGHQPMTHPATGAWLVFDGEIYNFAKLRDELEREREKFCGFGDIEVLLAGLLRHGNSFLNSLKGMFALAFYDARNGRLILSRDPAGIKPLYFARAESRLVFASEVRALLATRVVKPKLDRRGLAGFLAYGAVQHPYSLFRDMQSVPPGSTLEIALRADGEWTIAPPCRHWEYPRPDLHLTEAEAWPQVATLFEDAVRDLWMG